jgi:transposase
MEQVSIIGIDLAKRVFQAHGAAADGSVVFRKKLSRSQLLAFLTAQPRCTVAMEACATAHGWGREIGKLGHGARRYQRYHRPVEGDRRARHHHGRHRV